METMNLEQLFEAAFTDEKLQAKFYYEFLNSPLYVLGEASYFDGVLEEGSELKLVSLRKENEVFIPIFLSKASMENFLDGNEQQYLKAKGNDLLETLKKSNVVINPGREDSIVLYADEIQFILAQGKN
ncbi:MAG: SseB family protein [Erysipelotrichia bacterium]|nr:SseB family protein [Erysipelotrichia bacterium]NCC53948.1 SseB family protein [Erysipelotrichia bacterium]